MSGLNRPSYTSSKGWALSATLPQPDGSLHLSFVRDHGSGGAEVLVLDDEDVNDIAVALAKLKGDEG